jgi:hypothetical protein
LVNMRREVQEFPPSGQCGQKWGTQQLITGHWS